MFGFTFIVALHIALTLIGIIILNINIESSFILFFLDIVNITNNNIINTIDIIPVLVTGLVVLLLYKLIVTSSSSLYS